MKLQTKQSQIWEVDIGGGGGDARYLSGWLFLVVKEIWTWYWFSKEESRTENNNLRK